MFESPYAASINQSIFFSHISPCQRGKRSTWQSEGWHWSHCGELLNSLPIWKQHWQSITEIGYEVLQVWGFHVNKYTGLAQVSSWEYNEMTPNQNLKPEKATVSPYHLQQEQWRISEQSQVRSECQRDICHHTQLQALYTTCTYLIVLWVTHVFQSGGHAIVVEGRGDRHDRPTVQTTTTWW